MMDALSVTSPSARRRDHPAQGHREIREISTHDALRTRLQKRLDQLTRRAGKIEENLRRPQNPDWQERAVESENDEVLEHLDATTLEEVGQLEVALGWIDDWTYGTCARCGAPIGETRLTAVSYTLTCIGCAS